MSQQVFHVDFWNLLLLPFLVTFKFKTFFETRDHLKVERIVWVSIFLLAIEIGAGSKAVVEADFMLKHLWIIVVVRRLIVAVTWDCIHMWAMLDLTKFAALKVTTFPLDFITDLHVAHRRVSRRDWWWPDLGLHFGTCGSSVIFRRLGHLVVGVSGWRHLIAGHRHRASRLIGSLITCLSQLVVGGSRHLPLPWLALLRLQLLWLLSTHPTSGQFRAQLRLDMQVKLDSFRWGLCRNRLQGV